MSFMRGKRGHLELEIDFAEPCLRALGTSQLRMSDFSCHANISDDDGNLVIKSNDGTKRKPLAEGTYKMGKHSDPFDPNKNQIGLVYNMENGINLVDVENLPDFPPGKTRHMQAQEVMEGRDPNLKGQTPISGFAIQKGVFVFNSTTLNAQKDEYHDPSREMSELEKEKSKKE